MVKNSHWFVTGKRGNVEINNSPQAGIEPGASRFKIQQRYPSSAVLVVVPINPNHYRLKSYTIIHSLEGVLDSVVGPQLVKNSHWIKSYTIIHSPEGVLDSAVGPR